MMKKRNKSYFEHISVESLSPLFASDDHLVNGEMIMNGSTSSRTTSIKTLLTLRKRKNFSVILFVGLSALVCALYYTSNYPEGASQWTLRFGLTSFTRSTSGAPNENSGRNSLPQLIRSAARNSRENANQQDGDYEKAEKAFAASAVDGRNAENNGNDENKVSTLVTNSNSGNGENFGNDEEENIVKTLDWKYWAPLNYWKADLAGGRINEDDESEKSAGSISNLPPADSPRGMERSRKSSKEKAGESQLSCNFPRLNPFDPSITEFLKSPPTIDCTQSYPLVFRTNFRNKLIQWAHPFPADPISSTSPSPTMFSTFSEEEIPTETVKASELKAGSHNYSCCYKSITRGNGSDHNIIFSKRCFPIVKQETEIPPEHEFISVRCRLPRFYGTINSKSIYSTREPYPKNKSWTNASSIDTGNSIPNSSSSHHNNRTKMYKDLLVFVPLKAHVEERIRKYEESKRKLLYEANLLISHAKKVSESVKSESFNLPHESISSDSDRLSVVVLGLDAQSHMNFIRQMPLSYNFLINNLSARGLNGYTKVGDNTFPNVVTLLSGLSVDELVKTCWPDKDSYFDSCPFIWKDFAESGYRTSLAEDSVWMGTFNYEKKGFIQPPTDYYLHPLSLLMAKKIGHETLANAKLCYGPRLAFEVLLEYIVKTAVTFRDSLYFQFVWANSLFHDYLNNPRLGDELLEMTLKFLKSNGYLNNTAFILLSDHGIRWGSIRSTYQGKIEERMPLAYFTFPDWFRRKYPDAMRNLGRNANRLSTPFDVHETLRDILRLSRGEKVGFNSWPQGSSSGNKSGGERTSGFQSDSESSRLNLMPRGISLFRPIPLQRTCKLAGIEEHWCVCHSMQDVPQNSTLVQSGAAFVVKVINGLMSKHKESCAELKLYKINEAKRKIDGDIDSGLEIDFLAPLATTSATFPGESKSINRTTEIASKFKTEEVLGNVEGRANVTYSPSALNDSKKMVQLQIVIVTTPGHGVFEATIYGEAGMVNRPMNGDIRAEEPLNDSNEHWNLSGDISRLNLYGEQSACVSDYTIQKYCYCSNLDVN